MTVTADISPRSSPIESATLHYLTGFGAEATLPMNGGSGMDLQTPTALRHTRSCACCRESASPARDCVKESCWTC